jgi:hypothetical protein
LAGTGSTGDGTIFSFEQEARRITTNKKKIDFVINDFIFKSFNVGYFGLLLPAINSTPAENERVG